MSLTSVRVFGPGGAFLTELDEFSVGTVTWRLETGATSISVPYSSRKCTKTNLKAGNLLYLEFEDLPAWAGVMGNRSRGPSTLTMRAAQPRKLLSWRHTGAELIYSDSRNNIARGLITAANATYDTLVDNGVQITTSETAAMTYNYQQILTALNDLAAGEEYAIQPYLTNAGRLRFSLDWHTRRGQDRRDSVALIAGENVLSVSLDEQEPFYNQVIVIGTNSEDGSTWADRPVKTALDQDSRDRHGLRTRVIIRNDIGDETTLEALADDELENVAWPQMRATLNVINAEPVTFDEYDVGDIVTLDALQDHDEWVYNGAVRILARAWDPDDTCTLEVSEWLD